MDIGTYPAFVVAPLDSIPQGNLVLLAFADRIAAERVHGAEGPRAAGRRVAGVGLLHTPEVHTNLGRACEGFLLTRLYLRYTFCANTYL